MKMCKKFRAIALTLALALVAAFCGCFIVACNNSDGNSGNGENDGSGTSKDTISLAVASVSTGDDDLSTYVINASVNVQLTPQWAITWENADSEWASGKSVSDYLKLDLSNGNLTATVTCLQAFGETSVLTATIGQGSLAVSESKKIDYLARVRYRAYVDEWDSVHSTYHREYEVVRVVGNEVSSLLKFSSSYNSNLVTAISGSAFLNCTFSKAFLPNSLLKICGFAFDNCKYLESITIPASVTEIESYAFRGCSSLKEVIFLGDKSKITFGNNVFYGCPYQP